MRPRRKRKLTNYGEGHLHWIEESQLQKALIKSLRERSARPPTPSEDGQSNDVASPSKMPRLSVSVGRNPKTDINADMNCSVNVEDIMEPKRKFPRLLKSRQNKEIEKSVKTRILRSQRRGDEPHALMMQPRNSDLNPKDTKSSSHSSKTTESDPETASKSGALLQRAQRKYASNSSPPDAIRRCARFEAKFKTSGADRGSVQQKNEKTPPISDKSLPRTKDFLDYLCFRNTPLKFDLDTA